MFSEYDKLKKQSQKLQKRIRKANKSSKQSGSNGGNSIYDKISMHAENDDSDAHTSTSGIGESQQENSERAHTLQKQGSMNSNGYNPARDSMSS